VLVLAAAVAGGCSGSGKDTQRSPASTASTPSSSPTATTTIRTGGDGKYADIQTGVLTSKTTYVWEMEIGGGMTLRCVQNYN
jgi:hypothetical protein